eukprot:CAMPEP_0198220748 /NCGR_PEP_ID=MMETSP1445-20131203/80521_1 /TAXON_ID=36898 /ORGANISM="Pyramimonas sp., Strain CCMP2087" /LENGTH=112 /DNA_ID=CAMNT_0043898643 /DNA_START=89 /DNA_END=425 /DNA_ORIENTATION=+
MVWQGGIWNESSSGGASANPHSSTQGSAQHQQYISGEARLDDEDEDECFLCYNDVPPNVQFKPCGHSACSECVQRLRTANIFKADAGGSALSAAITWKDMSRIPGGPMGSPE